MPISMRLYLCVPSSTDEDETCANIERLTKPFTIRRFGRLPTTCSINGVFVINEGDEYYVNCDGIASYQVRWQLKAIKDKLGIPVVCIRISEEHKTTKSFRAKWCEGRRGKYSKKDVSGLSGTVTVTTTGTTTTMLIEVVNSSTKQTGDESPEIAAERAARDAASFEELIREGRVEPDRTNQ